MTLHVDRLGHGPVPMVLLHGWAMHGGVMRPLADALAAQCTLYVVDLPGHGLSRASTLPLEPRACAAAIAAVTPPAIWLGWSLGGLIALTAALDLPQHVRALAMVCATPKFVRDASWQYGSRCRAGTATGHRSGNRLPRHAGALPRARSDGQRRPARRTAGTAQAGVLARRTRSARAAGRYRHARPYRSPRRAAGPDHTQRVDCRAT